MARSFYTLDVFTETVLTGNPLAVVLDSEGLSDEDMQAIATEFNLSETVFVLPAEHENSVANIRIFTPAHELPFAGHPTVGTAILLNQLNHFGADDEFVLQEQVGPVPCKVERNGDFSKASFQLPKTAFQRDWKFDANDICDGLGIDPGSLDATRVEIWDGGVPYMLVPVSSLECVQNLVVNASKLATFEPVFDGISANPYVFCQGGEAQDTAYHARMFAPNFGIPEDPATGSAVASLSGWIGKHAMASDEAREFKIEQGYEMGRPSQIDLHLEKKNGSVETGWISGSAVVVSQGALYI